MDRSWRQIDCHDVGRGGRKRREEEEGEREGGRERERERGPCLMLAAVQVLLLDQRPNIDVPESWGKGSRERFAGSNWHPSPSPSHGGTVPAGSACSIAEINFRPIIPRTCVCIHHVPHLAMQPQSAPPSTSFPPQGSPLSARWASTLPPTCLWKIFTCPRHPGALSWFLFVYTKGLWAQGGDLSRPSCIYRRRTRPILQGKSRSLDAGRNVVGACILKGGIAMPGRIE